MVETATAKLDKVVSKVELERVWSDEQGIVNLPNLIFKVQGKEVTISADPRHGGKVSLEGIKRQFQIAMHRKYGPTFAIGWLDGPLPPVRFSHRSLFAQPFEGGTPSTRSVNRRFD